MAKKQPLDPLQARMLDIQQAYHRDKRRAIIVFEGTDAAGKGGAIKRITERLDPRGIKVWPIGPPSAAEAGHHYLHRFWLRLPDPGTIAIFDRSWYGRVLVERVEVLCDKTAWQRAYREINEFEQLMADDGVRVIKIFLRIDKKEQLRRFAERAEKPYKRWKIGEADIRAHEKWNEYEAAARDMLRRTSTRAARWNVVDGNDKSEARAEVMRIVTSALGSAIKLPAPRLDPGLRKKLEKLIGRKLKA